MALLGMQDVTIAFGGPPVLKDASFSIERGERVCLLGRNGAGKSTFMKLLDGADQPDHGTLARQSGVTVARLDQEVPAGITGTTFDVVAAGLADIGQLLIDYHAASAAVAIQPSDTTLKQLDRLHHALDAANAWQLHTRVETVLEHLSLAPEALFENASVGRKRQTLLARALVAAPDVLLLDEPTNHLDIDAVEWMETFLIDRSTTLVFVTHDRAFLRRVATRIVELDRGKLVDWGNDYDTYLSRKAGALHAEEKEWAEFDRKLAIEETWIRTGIQARRTRNEGRVRSLEAMRVERSDRRERVGAVRMQVQDSERSGKVVFEARNLSFSRGDRAIVRSLSTTIARGDRVGFIGPNGAGKTTLIRLLLGELPPDEGSVRQGTNLEIAYFDQLREQLDPDQSVFDVVADGTDFVEVNGSRMHVNGYLQNFLFPQNRVGTPVRALSGGERNRLLLARLFTRKFNVLVLDEPTNDLDLETLDLLEELLLDYEGTLLLVSHDREFLDHVVTSSLVFEGNGRVSEYAGGYTDWLRQRKTPDAAPPAAKRSVSAEPAAKAKKRKLSFREAKELADLPERIEAQEKLRDELFASLSDPGLLRDGGAVVAARKRIADAEAEIATLTSRWEQLETIAGEGDASA